MINRRLYPRIICISDLHLLDGSKADDFANGKNSYENSKKLIANLNSIEFDIIFILGDGFDFWQEKKKIIFQKYKWLIEELNKKNAIWITGNHDYSLGGRLSIDIETKSGKLIHFAHGFTNDKMMTNSLLRGFCWILGKIEKIGLVNIDNPDVLFKIKKQKSSIEKNTLQYAWKKIEEGYSIVVCGHTHNLKINKYILKEKEKYYLNTGTCQHSQFQGIWIDTYTDKIKKFNRKL